MATYKIEMHRAAAKALLALEKPYRQKIETAIDALAENPRPPKSKKMVGSTLEWRIRIGDYRVVYEIHDDRLIVLVIRVGHRQGIYK